MTWRVARELAAPVTPSPWLLANEDQAIVILSNEGTLSQFLGRIIVSLLAGAAAAAPPMRWRYQQTPRRLATKWIDIELPRWSEGADAVCNAALAMEDSTARTGRGLWIAPGVALSHEYEARAILLVGDPGSGKTVAIWSLLFQLHQRRCHLIVHDVKGDITERWPDDKVVLLAPHDKRSCGWAIGKDVVGEIAARELAAQLVAASERAPNWPNGAQEILVGVLMTLQQERKTAWGWRDLKLALDLPDADLREFATRYNPAAGRFLALGENRAFTLNAGSYVATLMAPINKLIAPLARAWGDLAPEYQISLRAWLDHPNPKRPALILQRAADLPALSSAWIGAVIAFMTRYLLASRQDVNPADAINKKPQPECWFVLDEFPQIQLDLRTFLPLLEIGRSLGLRSVIGMQNLGQVARPDSPTFPDQLRQLAGALIAFHLDPGPEAARICEGRLTKAPVRTWIKDEKTGKSSPASQDIEILPQRDLAELRITRDGPQGYLIVGSAAFGLTWQFPSAPKQRDGTIRAKWIDQ